MIKLHQAFYGRDPNRGYRLLASSNTNFNQIVEGLCAAVGTPDGISDIEPFYINYIANGYRFMISVCNGNPDDGGRKTLFFHAYIGNHQELCSADFGIGLLIHNNAFASKYTSGPVLEKTFEENAFSLPWGKTSIVWRRGEKLAIRNAKPDLPLISGILKNSFDETSWASFSYRPLDNFQLYVISEYVTLPSDRKCVSATGNLISEKKQPSSSVTKESVVPASKIVHRSKSNAVVLILLSVSIIANLIFSVVLFFHKDPQPKPEVKIVEKKVIVDRPGTIGPTRAEILAELRAAFDKNYKRLNGSWRKAMQDDPALCSQFEDYKKDPLFKAEGYIEFVHKYIFEEKELTK